MDGDDGDDDRVAQAWKALDGMAGDLEALRDKLAEANSMFPATREFLRRKGVANVMELSPEDRLELRAYLEAELAARTGKTGPSN